MNIIAKPFDEMTVPELVREHALWDLLLKNAKGWSSARQKAEDCRTACLAMIQQRMRESVAA